MYELNEKGIMVDSSKRSLLQISASWWRPLSILLLLVSLVASGASPAEAAQPHQFAGSFGPAGTGPGKFGFTLESGLAVDQSNGDVYVTDTDNHRVEKFSSSGSFLFSFGWGVRTGDTSSTGLDVCAASCQAGFPGAGPGQFEKPTFITVDNTPGGAGAGDVYVADLGSVANEQQTVTVSGASGGTLTLSFTSPLNASTTNGTNVITNVDGPYRISDPISGPGIPAGTTILRAEPSSRGDTLTLSAAAIASGRAILGVTETTGGIGYHASAEELQTALEGLQSLKEGGTSVIGTAGGPYTVKFPLYPATSLAPMTCDGSGLSPAGASCTVARAIRGFNTARVEKFDSSGNLIAGWGVNAAGPSSGGVPPGEIDGTTSSLLGFDNHFGRLEGVGVNPEGNLLVLSHSGMSAPSISEWTQSSGEIINALDPHGTYGRGGPVGMAVDPAGHVYMGGVSVPEEIVQTFLCNTEEPNSPCPESNEHEGFTYWQNFVIDSGPATGAAVDPSTEDVYVAHFNPITFRSDVAGYNSEGKALEIFGGNGEIVEARSIAVSGFSGSKSDVYVADKGTSRVEIFAPGGSGGTLSVTRAGSGLGSVVSVPVGIACPSICSGTFLAGEEVTLTATAPEHSSFLGWSGGGCSGAGACQISLTADTAVTAIFAQDRPALTTTPTLVITRQSATLSGVVNPEGDPSSCRFEYGTTSAYGADSPCSTHPGSGVSPVAVSAELWELTASTTYHYRLVSANTGGASYGPDETFTTVSESCASNAALCPALPSVPPLVNEGLVFSKQRAATTTTRALTKAQKLSRALKACRNQRKSARISCEKRARKRYRPAKKKPKSQRAASRGGRRGVDRQT